MSKSAWIGLIIALFVPIGSYLLVKILGEEAVNMPPKYFADSVTTTVKDGKTKTDTAWHRIPNFTLTNQLGQPLSLHDLSGKIVVVNTFFTRCPNICPALTRNIRKLQSSFENPKRKKFGDTSVVYFLSVSIDPERDSVEALKRWSDRFFVNTDNWSLLTGQRQAIYDLMLQEFRLASQHGGNVDSLFIHSEKVILLDRTRVVRGYYNGLDSVEMGRLAEDIGKLYLEKDRSRPSVFRQYIPLIPVLASVPVIWLLGMYLLRRTRRKAGDF